MMEGARSLEDRQDLRRRVKAASSWEEIEARTDAEPDQFVESPKMVGDEDDAPIDWGNVASEVKLMLELNQGAAAEVPAEDQEP